MWKPVAVTLSLVILAYVAVSTLPSAFTTAPITADDLEFTAVDLGEVSPSSLQDFGLLVSNPTSQHVALLPSDNSCGCIRTDNNEVTIRAKSRATIQFRLRTPDAPGQFSHTVSLIARDSPEVRWKVPISGTVTGEIWAVPPSVVIDYDSGSVRKARVLLYHKKDLTIGKVVATSSALTLGQMRTADDSTALEIELQPPMNEQEGKGHAVIQVFDPESEKELLRIPVAWQPRARFRCLPDPVTFDEVDDSAGKNLTTVIVLSSGKEKDAIQAKSLVPWIRVEAAEPKPFGLSLQLRVSAVDVPSNFEGPVLQLSSKEDATPFLLWGRR
jgi:hypothetical protein